MIEKYNTIDPSWRQVVSEQVWYGIQSYWNEKMNNVITAHLPLKYSRLDREMIMSLERYIASIITMC